jgi:23S rRNA pseudouridine1911/1915/1917 synthase
VHRLDKDTSGIIVVAKTRYAHDKLSKQFHDRTIQRKYVALALIMPRRLTPLSSTDLGKIELPIGRDPHQRTLMKINGIGSRRAVTHFEVEKRLPFCALLSLRLETGRTHQIRVHCAAVGCPLIGDPIYGEDHLLPPVLQRASKELGRQALHATQLGFYHPDNNKFLLFNSPFPEDFNQIYSVFNNEIARKNHENC